MADLPCFEELGLRYLRQSIMQQYRLEYNLFRSVERYNEKVLAFHEAGNTEVAFYDFETQTQRALSLIHI